MTAKRTHQNEVMGSRKITRTLNVLVKVLWERVLSGTDKCITGGVFPQVISGVQHNFRLGKSYTAVSET